MDQHGRNVQHGPISNRAVTIKQRRYQCQQHCNKNYLLFLSHLFWLIDNAFMNCKSFLQCTRIGINIRILTIYNFSVLLVIFTKGPVAFGIVVRFN